MGSISSSRWNNNSNNLKKVVAIAVMIFILFVISEVANAVQRRKTTLALHVTIDHDDELSATADSYDVVSNASLFSSLDAELEWDRYMIPDYDYHQNRVNNNNNNNNIDEGKGSTNPSSSASRRDTERKLFEFNRNTSHYLRRKQK
jgi:hypothetical protein